MLELTHLLVQDWTRAAEEVSRRPILDADTERPAGFACWQPRTGPWWERLTPLTLEVREQVDASLVFLVRRRWGFGASWEIHDADWRLTAVLRRGWIEDARGATIAFADWNDSGGRLRGLHGEELGMLTPVDGGIRVTFASGVGENPFLRMAILTAALRW